MLVTCCGSCITASHAQGHPAAIKASQFKWLVIYTVFAWTLPSPFPLFTALHDVVGRDQGQLAPCTALDQHLYLGGSTCLPLKPAPLFGRQHVPSSEAGSDVHVCVRVCVFKLGRGALTSQTHWTPCFCVVHHVPVSALHDQALVLPQRHWLTAAVLLTYCHSGHWLTAAVSLANCCSVIGFGLLLQWPLAYCCSVIGFGSLLLWPLAYCRSCHWLTAAVAIGLLPQWLWLTAAVAIGLLPQCYWHTTTVAIGLLPQCHWLTAAVAIGLLLQCHWLRLTATVAIGLLPQWPLAYSCSVIGLGLLPQWPLAYCRSVIGLLLQCQWLWLTATVAC
eukprot:1160754-Pelagomonas_calceolata.AAC.3